jgi:hexokinase
MQNTTPETSEKSSNLDQNKQAVLKEICAKWGKFSEQDASSLKGKSDLVSQVVAKYGIDQSQALREVDALLKGRQVGAGA